MSSGSLILARRSDADPRRASDGDHVFAVVERAGREQLAAVEPERPRQRDQWRVDRRAADRSARRCDRARRRSPGAHRPCTSRSCSGSRAPPTPARPGPTPSASARSARVAHRRREELARRRRGPGCTRSPSPCVRSGPHTKQLGNGCHSGCTMTGELAAACSAAAERRRAGGRRRRPRSRGPRRSTLAADGQRDAIVVESTVIGVSSGAGRRNVTSAGPSIRAASSPAVTPPFPRSGGPRNRVGMTISRRGMPTILPAPLVAGRSLRRGRVPGSGARALSVDLPRDETPEPREHP